MTFKVIDISVQNVPPELRSFTSSFTVRFSGSPPLKYEGTRGENPAEICLSTREEPPNCTASDPLIVVVDYKIGAMFKKKGQWRFRFGPSRSSERDLATDELNGKVVLSIIRGHSRQAQPSPAINLENRTPAPVQTPVNLPRSVAPEQSPRPPTIPVVAQPVPSWSVEIAESIANPSVVAKIYHRAATEKQSRCAALVISNAESNVVDQSEFSLSVGKSVVLTLGENSSITSSLWRPELALELNGHSAARTHETRSTQTGDLAQLTARSPETALRLADTFSAYTAARVTEEVHRVCEENRLQNEELRAVLERARREIHSQQLEIDKLRFALACGTAPSPRADLL